MDRLTKRRFLKNLALAGGAVVAAPLLAACGSAPAATPAPAKATEAPKPTEVAKPTEAPKPTAAAAKPTEAPKATEAAKPTVAPAAKAPPKEIVTLRFHMRTGGEKSEPSIYQQRPDEWSQETGHKYKLEPIPGGQDYVPKLEALAASNTIGDLTWTSDVYSEHTHFVKYNVLAPVDEFLGPYNVKKTEWFQPIVDTLTYNGKMYGLPKTGHPGDSYIWINLNAFQEAGIKEPPTYGNTFDDIVNWAVKLAKGPKDRRDVYGYYSNVGGIMPITNAIRQFGGDVVDKEGKKSLADSDQWMSWLQWNDRIINQEKVHPLADSIPSGGLESLFGSGKLAMVHTQRYFQRAARVAVGDKFKFTTIQFPRGSNPKGWAICIDTHSGTAASKYKEVTFTLLYALADRRFAYLVGKDSGYLTGRVDNLDALKELASDHFIQLQQKCVEQGEQFWRAANLRAYEFQTALTNNLDLLWLGKRKLDKSYLTDMKNALDEVLAKPA